MKSIRMYGTVAGTLALLLAGLTSARASFIDTTTEGDWLDGGPGGTQVYGTSGYILCDYTGTAVTLPSTTAPGTYDVAKLPTWANFPYNYSVNPGYAYLVGAGPSSPSSYAPYLEDPTTTGNRALDEAYETSPGTLTVNLTLAANTPRFQLAIYSFPYGGAPGDETISFQLDSATIDSANLTETQAKDGTWAVFDVNPAGDTQLSILVTSSDGHPFISGIMFDKNIPEPSLVVLLGMGGFVLFSLRHGFPRRSSR